MGAMDARKTVLGIALKRFQSCAVELSGAQISELEHDDAVVFVYALKLCRTMELVFEKLVHDAPSSGVEDVVAILEERRPYAQEHARHLRSSYSALRNASD